jgi:hypothetical protein
MYSTEVLVVGPTSSVFRHDPVAHTITLDGEPFRSHTPPMNGISGGFLYNLSSTGELVLTGRVGADSVYLRLQKVNYPLMSRGFHWIQEEHYNR